MADLPFAKKPAIFVKAQAKIEELLATAVLYQTLKTQQKEVTVFTAKNEKLVAALKSLVSDMNIKHEMPAKKFVLSVKKDSANVQAVQWQQDEEYVKIFLTLAQGKISPSSLKIDVQGGEYDLAILPNVSELGQLGELQQKYGDHFKDMKLHAIGADLNVGDAFQVSSANRPNLTTLSEQVFFALNEGNLKTEQAQMLLAGIMHETKNLKSEIKSAEIFVVMKKLVEKGASPAKVDAVLAKLQGFSGGATGGAQAGQGGQSAQGDANKSGDKPNPDAKSESKPAGQMQAAQPATNSSAR